MNYSSISSKRSLLLIAAITVTLFLLLGTAQLVVRSLPARVPDLDGLSRIEAEKQLRIIGLQPVVKRSYAPGYELDEVIRASQSPKRGALVAPAASVQFTVAGLPDDVKARIHEPANDQTVECVRENDGIHRFRVKVIASGVERPGLRLLLWVRPVTKEVGSWYLQMPPGEGIYPRAKGEWTGSARLGNEEWPPHDGDQVALVLTVLGDRKGVETQTTPAVADLPVGVPLSDEVRVRVALRVRVPKLANLPGADAIQLLEGAGLQPVVSMRFVPQLENGVVVPGSQVPAAGTVKEPGGMVRYAVATTLPPGVSVTITEPALGEKIRCARGSDGEFRFVVAGRATGVQRDQSHLLLWVRPTPTNGQDGRWYLQLPPTEGLSFREGASWIGRGRIGNQESPPQRGDRVDLAITLMPARSANALYARHKSIEQPEPLGARVAGMKGVVIGSLATGGKLSGG
jgi:hypothetical protein